MNQLADAASEVKSVPLVLFPSLCVDPAESVALSSGLLVMPLGTLRDETLFDQVVGVGEFKPLLRERDLEKRLVLAASPDSEHPEPSMPERARLLLALHPRTSDFDPAHARSVTLQFIRSRSLPQTPSASAAIGNILLDGKSISPEDAVATISGLALQRPLQSIDTQCWKDEGIALAIEPDQDEAFALALYHLMDADVAGLWPALRLFSLGIRSLYSEGREFASAMIAAAFESLFPIQGKESVTGQFKAIGTLLVDIPGMGKWFERMYDVRSSIFHRGRIESDKQLQHVPRLVRDVELAKFVFQYCALQLDVLHREARARFANDEAESCITAKRWWIAQIEERLGWDNAHLCKVLHECEWDDGLIRGYRFDSDDSSASVLDLLHAGWKLFSLQVNHLRVPDVVEFLNGYREYIGIVVNALRLVALAEAQFAPSLRKTPKDATLSKIATKLSEANNCDLTKEEFYSVAEVLDSTDVRMALVAMPELTRKKILENWSVEINKICREMRLLLISMIVKFSRIADEGNTIFDLEGMELVHSWCDVVQR
ncbi:MAG: hypothetical protein KDA54_21235 [Phycisphaerales bacterium]|nr:hypothetical protein [Phycisphaerales bacterium]